jgi:DegT/DnrJ/EryC1/StrS aminotransferase family
MATRRAADGRGLSIDQRVVNVIIEFGQKFLGSPWPEIPPRQPDPRHRPCASAGPYGRHRPAHRIRWPHGLRVIEDSREAIASRFEDQHAGTIGHLEWFSTNDRQVLSSGQGGFILTECGRRTGRSTRAVVWWPGCRRLMASVRISEAQLVELLAMTGPHSPPVRR